MQNMARKRFWTSQSIKNSVLLLRNRKSLCLRYLDSPFDGVLSDSSGTSSGHKHEQLQASDLEFDSDFGSQTSDGDGFMM
jgi:hypothetical protein